MSMVSMELRGYRRAREISRPEQQLSIHKATWSDGHFFGSCSRAIKGIAISKNERDTLEVLIRLSGLIPEAACGRQDGHTSRREGSTVFVRI